MAASAAAPPSLLDADMAAPKYTEAVAVAAEKCAGDTKGQTCYICTEALHWKTKEGLVRMCACRGSSGFAHVSCLAEQAKILFDEAEENNLGDKAMNERWTRWHKCSLCNQDYHGTVACALGWACWKTYVGRPEGHWIPGAAMALLGSGLSNVNLHEDALSVREAEVARLRRFGGLEETILAMRRNIANSHQKLGRNEQALRLMGDVYSGYVKLKGEEHRETLLAANNYAASFLYLKRFEEAKSLMRKTIPVARRVLGESNQTLKMRAMYATALYDDPAATRGDLREATTTLEDIERTTRRVLGGAHPLARTIERNLQEARGALYARESVAVESIREAVAAMTAGDA